MLDFERDDGEEADEIAEEDLIFLKDQCIQLDLIVIIKIIKYNMYTFY